MQTLDIASKRRCRFDTESVLSITSFAWVSRRCRFCLYCRETLRLLSAEIPVNARRDWSSARGRSCSKCFTGWARGVGRKVLLTAETIRTQYNSSFYAIYFLLMDEISDVHFDLKQAAAACAAGGIVSAELRVIDGSFYVAFETLAGAMVELVKSNGRDRRLFRDATAALKIIRELGISHGRFSLEGWDVHAPKLPAWTRPDKAMDMRERHRRAVESMQLESRGPVEPDPLSSDAHGSASSSKQVRRARGNG
jgi:hypothetical protein